MPISKLLADNLFVRLVRGSAARAGLTVSMTGVKLGERLLVIGLSDDSLLAALGAKVGLTGRACGVDVSPDAVARARRRAEQEGVLVEVEQAPAPFDRVPFEDHFDLVVVRVGGSLTGEDTCTRVLVAASRVLRDGGRCEVLADAPGRGLLARSGSAPRAPSGQELVRLLTQAHYRGARVLVEREGLVFVEAAFRHGGNPG
jgi:SAM-dependent methyltransferase